MSMPSIIALVIGISSFLSAILVIINFKTKMDQVLNSRIRKIAIEVFKEKQVEEEKLNNEKQERLRDLINNRFTELVSSIQALSESQENFVKVQQKLNTALSHGHIETWKNDIRTIYYNLRDTGTITDSEKSYIDKIYHIYKELGGNSDIDSKYGEICDVYKARTKERYNEVYENRKKGVEENK